MRQMLACCGALVLEGTVPLALHHPDISKCCTQLLRYHHPPALHCTRRCAAISPRIAASGTPEAAERERFIVKIKSHVSEEEIYNDFAIIYRRYKALRRQTIGDYFFKETEDLVDKLCDDFERMVGGVDFEKLT